MRIPITAGGSLLLAFAILAGANARAETLGPRSNGRSSADRPNADAPRRPAAPVLLSVEVVPEHQAAKHAREDAPAAAPNAARAEIDATAAMR